jgi:hypothetical protein
MDTSYIYTRHELIEKGAMQMRMGNPFAYCEASASKFKASIHEGCFASSGRPACALSGEKPGLESHSIPCPLLSFICPAKVKKVELEHTPHPWMTQHPLHCYLLSTFFFSFLQDSIRASCKLAERYPCPSWQKEIPVESHRWPEMKIS